MRLPIVRDNAEQLAAALDEALACADLVMLGGGSSRGGEDFNAGLLEKRGEFFHHGVKAVPGRPVGIAMINGKPAVNIPGPVLATWLASEWLIKGLVCHYYGLPVPARRKVSAVLAGDIRKGPGFEMLSRVSLERDGDGLVARPIPRSSSLPTSMREADGLLILPIGSRGAQAGSSVEVELLKGEELI